MRRVLLLVCCEPRGRSDGEVMSDRCWFVVESKSQNLVEAVDGKLQGIILERSRGFSLSIWFGDLSLSCLLEGVEACYKKERVGRFVKS